MKTYTTPTGAELLLPLVPKEADKLNIAYSPIGNKYPDGWELNYATYGLVQNSYIDLPQGRYTILGTCWYEGDKIMYDDQLGILDWVVGDSYYMDQEVAFNSWLRTNNINIPEGFKRVLIQVK